MDRLHSILIVEDESVVSMHLEMSLERLGYAITASVTSGEEALEAIQRTKPDLVLMDIQLRGEMDGLTAAEAIHQQFSVPVVFVTANANGEMIARSKESGAYGFLNKPFRSSELDATIQIALHQHRTGQALSAERERLEAQVVYTSEALGQTREELQALSRHLMQAQEEERARIARELHDDLGQRVALLGMQTDLLQSVLPQQHREKIAVLHSGLSDLSQGLREVSHKLHPSVLTDLGLTEALRSLLSGLRSQGMNIRESLCEPSGIPDKVNTAFYRIAQESLNNIRKHAPHANVQVTLTASARALTLKIVDDGQGFSLGDVRQQGGLGLISMQERARLIGGNLLLTAEPGKGTTVLVRVLLRPADLVPSRTGGRGSSAHAGGDPSPAV